MAIIFYATTQNDFFCKKADKDDLSWMKISTDRQFFKFLTCTFNNYPLICGSKTFDNMPPLKNRKILRISRNTITLDLALKIFPNSIIIGGHEIIEMTYKYYKNKVSSILTARLNIDIKENANNFKLDPLLKYKYNGEMSLLNKFKIAGTKNDDKEIILEYWN